jgi:AraC-like DNA-binding protein
MITPPRKIPALLRVLFCCLFSLLASGSWAQLPVPQQTAGHATPPAAELVRYRFVVTALPANTPEDAALYLVGSFNNWRPADARYRLRRQANGTYTAEILSGRPELEYKVSRGSWASVEGDARGDVRANRVATRAAARAGSLEVRVRSWEDLTGTFQFYSLYDLLLLFSCFQGVLLLVAIPSIQQANWAANRWLLAVLALSAGFTLLKVVSGYRDVANALPTLQLVPDLIGFLYGPLFYFYLRSLLFHERIGLGQRAYHFIPAGLQLLAYLPYFLLDGYEFQLKLVSHDALLRGVLLTTGLVALGSNVGYWLACRRTLRAYTRAYQARVAAEQNLAYLTTVLGIQAVCLGLWAFLFGAVLVSRVLAFDIYTLADRNVDLIWLVFSAIPYFLGYVAIHQPEVFKVVPPTSVPVSPAGPLATAPASASASPAGLMPPAGSPAPTARAAAVPSPEAEALQESLRRYMLEHQPYLDPNLSLHALAAGLQLPPHVLSRVINDGFGQSFFDFVNGYRVEAFKRRMRAPDAGRFTLLSLALEVGFNSKTAFNRAFKKHTGQTPREHLHDLSTAE